MNRARCFRIALCTVFCAGVAAAGPMADADRGADPVLLERIREGFRQAPDSAPATRELIAALERDLPVEVTAWPPVLRAYRAALEGLLGKHAHAPWAKYRHAKDGLARFEGLVEAHPDSIEIRMLRYTTCRKLPEFFGMRPQADADLDALVALFETRADPDLPADLRQGYLQWILTQGGPSPEQRQRLERAGGRLVPD